MRTTTFTSKSSIKSVFILLGFLAPLSSQAAPASAKAYQAMGAHPYFFNGTDKAVFFLAETGDTYLFDRTTQKQIPLTIGSGPVYPNYYPYYSPVLPMPEISLSADGKIGTHLPNPVAGKNPIVEFFDLSQPTVVKYQTEETRALTQAPQVSPSGDAYAITGRYDGSSYYTGPLIWTADLAEQMWDLSLGVAQPSGYYLKTIFRGNPQVYDPNRYVYPDSVMSLAWSQDSQKIAFSLLSYDSRSYPKASLRIYDRTTGKIEDIPTSATFQQLVWPAGDYVYGINSSSGYKMTRLDIVKKTSDTPLTDPLVMGSFGISHDSAYYTLIPPTAPPSPAYKRNALAQAELYDVANKKKISLEGVQGFRFSPTDDTVALTRANNPVAAPKAPMIITTLKALLAKEKSGMIAWSEIEKLGTAVGEAVLSYSPPTDPAEFKAEFTMKTSTPTNIGGSYFYVGVQLHNRSQNYYSFALTSQPALVCEVYDDKGTLISLNSVYPMQPQQQSQLLVGPGSTAEHYCNSQLTSPPTFGTTGKLVFYLHGYEKESRMEQPLPF